MNLQEQKQTEAGSEEFSFVWKGGFSYLTYLKKTSKITLFEDRLTVQTQNFILGAFPGRIRLTDLPYSSISSVSVSSKMNWFDMTFAILFAIVTLAAVTFWPLLLTAFFLLRTFNTAVSLTDNRNNRTYILSDSKSAANLFADKVTQKANQHNEMILADGTIPNEPIAPIVPVKETNKKKTTFLVGSAAAVALLVLIVGILSRGGFENKYVQWAKESTALPGKGYMMNELLQNEKYFSNVKWTQVTRNGNENDVDKFVMYESTFSDQGVSVHIRSILQVFAPNQLEPVEFSVDGDQYELPDWTLFLVDAAEKYEGKQVATVTKQTKATPALPTPSPSQQPKQTQQPSKQVDSTFVQNQSGITLASFLVWETSDKDKQLPLKLDGEKASIVVGNNTPNGIKLGVLLDNMQTVWELALPVKKDSPFDDFGNLKSGFNLYLKDHDFDGDNTPEVVIAASNQMDQTFVWVFGYNFVALENGTAPLELLLNAEGQSDIAISKNKLTLPYGSQGLFNEFTYTKGKFVKT